MRHKNETDPGFVLEHLSVGMIQLMKDDAEKVDSQLGQELRSFKGLGIHTDRVAHSICFGES